MKLLLYLDNEKRNSLAGIIFFPICKIIVETVVVVVKFKILSDIMIIILCAALVFQSTLVVSLCGYASAATTTTTTMKLPTVVKMLVDKAIQEFQSNDVNNAITYLQG